VGLVVEIEAVGDQFFDIDLGRSLAAPVTGTAATARAAASFAASITTISAIGAAFPPFARAWPASAILVRRPIFAATLFCFLLFHFCHG
jgi:hypothetical protein